MKRKESRADHATLLRELLKYRKENIPISIEKIAQLLGVSQSQAYEEIRKWRTLGLLEFVKDSYTNTLEKYQGQNLSEESVLNQSIGYLHGIVENTIQAALNGTVSQKGIKGLQRFVSENFKDLIAEIHQEKKQEGQAMQTEIEHISKYLERFSI